MSRDILPVVLVSARDATAATKIISDLIDNETPHVGKDGKTESENVWRIVNKYYTVDVRLVPVTDAHDDTQKLHFDEDSVEAHIIYFTEDECAGTDPVVQAGAARARLGVDAHVRLALAAGAPSLALRHWACSAHYELVPLLCVGEGEDGDGEDDSQSGVERAREALHAHAWRGLVRRGREGEGQEEEVERQEEEVEQAEGFAAALGALSSAAAATRALEGAARLDAAEDLVAAFCRALGVRPDDC